MTSPTQDRSRTERVVSDIVMAELFLVQATIESASMLGSSWKDLRDQMSSEVNTKEDFGTFLERTRKQLMEPYSSRFKYMREGIDEAV